MKKEINWGIIGLGNIAHKFANDLLLSKESKLYGVASRNIDKANEFGKKFKTVKYYGSYEELTKDPHIDIVYIATPHSLHYDNTMMCLKEGKAVLCEKPMGLNTQQVAKMITEAKTRKLFLMEAMWTRFIPSTQKLLDIINNGVIGKINFIRADFGFKAYFDPSGRVYNKKLGGGSLMDIGIYPIYLSLLLLGIPSKVKAFAKMSKTEVDTYCAMITDYKNGEKAILESTFETKTPTKAYIYGEKGTLIMHSPFHHTKKISLTDNGKLIKQFKINYKGNGYYHEIEEAVKCIKTNKTYSDKHSLSDSLNLITVIDLIKKEIGLNYY
jgi:predicted dehydrogenase